MSVPGTLIASIVSIIIAVCSLSFAVFAYHRNRKPKRLTYEFVANQRIVTPGRHARSLAVLLGDRTLDDPRVVSVRIRNTGRSELTAADFETPLTVRSIRNSEILNPTITFHEEGRAELTVEPTVQTPREVVAPKTLMNPGDWIEFELLIEGYEDDLEVYGRVAGTKLQLPSDPSAAGRAIRRIVTVTNVGVLVVTIGIVAWWLGVGRWTTVPPVVGLSAVAAVNSLQEANLDPVLQQVDSARPSGEIVFQSIKAGEEQIRGTDVLIQVSIGP